MADPVNDLRSDLEKQIAELKKEMGRLNDSAGTQIRRLKSQAEDAAEEAADKARDLAHRARHRVEAAASAAQENPVAASAVLLMAGMAIGFLLWGRR